MPLLALKNVRKAYTDVPALSGVALTIGAGEIHALMGENGAGKSTLIKILAGVVTPDHAEIEIEGCPVSIPNPAAATALGLRFIHQELSVVPTLSVAENIFLGRPYPNHAGIAVNWGRLATLAQAALARLGITHIEPRQKMAKLSFADQMLVRISSAFLDEASSPARLYVMDEPTAALSRDESERLFTVLGEIRNAGRSVLYVSHRLDEVMRLSDMITILRDGETVATGATQQIGADEVVRLMLGRRIDDAYSAARRPVAGEPALQVTALRSNRAGPFTFTARRGEIIGLAGLAGAGQGDIIRLLAGADRATGGEIMLGGKPHRGRGPAAAWAAGLAHVPRERRAEGLVLTRSIMENITLPHLGQLSRGGTILARARERKTVLAGGADVRLKSTGPSQLARELSGGNQQKVAFAKALAGHPQVLLLDEPTRGVDIGARFDIYSLIRDMTAKGMTVLMTSSDLPELVGMCDRILVVRDGDVTAELDATGLTEEALLNACYGRAATPLASIADASARLEA
jgi:ribose transport system ATP-binding protein